MTNLKWKVSGVVLIILLSAYYLNYTVRWQMMSEKERVDLSEKDQEMFMKKSISFGLDLQGGMHLVLAVKKDKVRELAVNREIKDLKEKLADDHLEGEFSFSEDNGKYYYKSSAGTTRDKVQGILSKSKLFDATSNADGSFMLSVNELKINIEIDEATNRALEVLRNRIDEFGVSEPVIRRQGENSIIVELAGIKDPERAKKLIGKRAVLEFKMVEEDEALVAGAEAGNVPTGYDYLEYIKTDRRGSEKKEKLLVRSTAEMTGEYLKDAHIQYDPMTSKPEVGFVFGGKGADLFAEITENNIGKRLAIILDNKVQSAPTIQSRIYGSGRIEGNFDVEEAKDLAIVLRAGALPAPIEVIEDRTVGPSLGQDSIRSGKRASLYGMLLVVIFMVFRYKFSGFLADIALVINVFVMLAVLAMLHATLTLPGIAGIALTVGMAVDANAIIFERIKEELASGKTTASAVNIGFERGWVPVFDANVTTLIAAFFLYYYGTGPIKGFAVTLSIGIVSSIIAAFYFSKTFFDMWLTQRIEKLSI